jgi:GTP cyclohydrolase I
MTEERKRPFKQAWESIIDSLDQYEDWGRDGLRDTPRRLRDGHLALLRGYEQDPRQILGTVFESGLDQMIIVKDIEFYSMCEHHFLPFWGKAHVAYIPNGKVVGLSKVARLVDCYARRLQLQERLTEQIAHQLMEVIRPQGVGVLVQAQHLCMMARGIQKQESSMVTSCMLGVFREDSKVRQEFLALCQIPLL